MGLSKSTSIKLLLAIDTAFFFLEIIVGYSVGSLALVADSFHMLNDVCSLLVALYALKLAENSTRSSKYSYGWQRAEILGALINGVFLLALCFSIFLEAIQRMFGAPEVGSPKLVVIVGSLGLASNILGLFLFHEHGHSHGGAGHSHGHSHGAESVAEEGHSHAVGNGIKKGIKNGHTSNTATESSPLLQNAKTAPLPTVGGAETPLEDGDDVYDDLLVHPARTREAIVRQAYDAGFGSPRNNYDTISSGHRRSPSTQSQSKPRKDSLYASRSRKSGSSDVAGGTPQQHSHSHENGDGHEHEHEHDHGDEEHEHGGHDHDSEEESHGGHGHSHADMNMRGVFLHVLGDALGNVGVIAAGLIIWLTKSPYRFYSDPAISFIITCIIFSSALPLVRSASFILLQGTPSHVPLEKVRQAILNIDGVISVHDLHIWSLSESKLVASLHVLVQSNDEFSKVSDEIRKLLHRFGVHSSTIQPELLDGNVAASVAMSRPNSAAGITAPGLSVEIEGEDGCTVQCVDDSCVDNACCPPIVSNLAQKSNASLRTSADNSNSGSSTHAH